MLDLELSDQFMQMGWGRRHTQDDGSATRYEMGEGGSGAIVDYIVEPDREPGGWTFGEGRRADPVTVTTHGQPPRREERGAMRR